jgi:hypothetical protein
MKRSLFAAGLVILLCGAAQAQSGFRSDAWRDYIGGAGSASSPAYANNAGPNRNQKLSHTKSPMKAPSLAMVGFR